MGTRQKKNMTGVLNIPYITKKQNKKKTLNFSSVIEKILGIFKISNQNLAKL